MHQKKEEAKEKLQSILGKSFDILQSKRWNWWIFRGALGNNFDSTRRELENPHAGDDCARIGSIRAVGDTFHKDLISIGKRKTTE